MLLPDILLLSAIALLAPPDGAVVPALGGLQKEYLAKPRAERFRIMADGAERRRIVREGAVQPPLRLAWTGAGEGACEIEFECGGEKQTLWVTNRSDAYVTNLEIGRKYRWTVRSGGESASAQFETEDVPPRLLRIDGVANIRDCGGWKGLGGRRVRQGMILRSSGLRSSAKRLGKSILSSNYEAGGTNITEKGLAVLRDEFRIKTDIELRGVQETVCMQDSALGRDVRWVKTSCAAYDFITDMVRGKEPFAALFQEFLDERNYPVLFHCSGGRDRTGTLAFLLNGLLGVSEDDLCRDWEASIFSEGNLEFGTSRIERLLSGLKRYGGGSITETCERYARSCGIVDSEIAKFRSIMLEPEGAGR